MKCQFVMKIFQYHLVSVRPLSELRLSSLTIFVANTNMSVSSAQFLRFLQNVGKWIKRGQNLSKHGRVESCGSANRELVASVTDRCYDITCTKIGRVVFLNTYFQSLILKQLCDKLRLSWLEKSFL